MTLTEARDLLGIDAQASRDQARRAYLRLVKVYKPEKDPEGFRRLREAYERVENATANKNLVWEHLVPVPTGEGEPEAPPAEAEREPEVDKQPPPQVERVELDLGGMLVRARQEVEAARPAQGRDLALRALEIGAAAGHERALPLTLVLEVFFTLQAIGALADSEQVLAAAEAFLEKGGEEALLAEGGQVVMALRLARELASIPAEFPDDLRDEIARSILAGDFSLAKSAMHELVLSDPAAAREAAEGLRAAPLLSHHYDFILSGPSEAGGRRPSAFVRWFFPVFFGFGFLMHLFVPEPDGSSRDRVGRAAQEKAFLRTELMVRHFCAQSSARQDVAAYCQAAEAFLLEHKRGDCTSSQVSLRSLADGIGAIEYVPDFIAKSFSQFERAHLAQCVGSQTPEAPGVEK